MNWDQFEGQWKQYAGEMREKWGKLTDNDWAQIAGKRDQLIGKIQERYGIAKGQAESQIEDFVRKLNEASHGSSQERARSTSGSGH